MKLKLDKTQMHVLHSMYAHHGISMVLLNSRTSIMANYQCHLLQEGRHRSAHTDSSVKDDYAAYLPPILVKNTPCPRVKHCYSLV